MRPSQKLAISLLIATLLFAAFSVMAFSGLFPLIETQFFSPRIVRELQQTILSAREKHDSYKVRTNEGLELLIKEPYFTNVFNPAQSKSDISLQYSKIKLYLKSFKGASAFRVVDNDFQRIHFSSMDEDMEVSEDFITFKNYTSTELWPGADELRIFADSSPGGGDRVFTALGTRIYLRKMVDPVTGAARGWALLAVSTVDEAFDLFHLGVIPDRRFYVPWSDGSTFLSYSDVLKNAVLTQAAGLYKADALDNLRYLTDDEMRLVMVTDRKNAPGWLLIVPAEVLQLTDLLKGIILVSLFTMIFLPLFILLNLRPEPEILWSRRIKRMQLQILTTFMEGRKKEEKSAFGILQSNAQGFKEELKRGIGKIPKKKQALVDSLIDHSWDEILELLGAKQGSPPSAPPSADIDRIEKLLKEALSRGAISVSAPVVKPSPASTGGKTGTKAPILPNDEPMEVVVEDLEEAEAVEDLDEAEAVEDLEEAEAVEDLDEAEAVEDLEEAEAVEDLEEAEAVEDLEEAEAVEDLEEAEAVEDLEEAEAVEDLEEAEAVEEFEEAEALEELEYLPAAASHDASGSQLLPVMEGQDFYLYSGMATAQQSIKGSLKVIGGAELPSLEEENATMDPSIKSFTLEEVTAYYQGLTRPVLEEKSGVFEISPEAFEGESPLKKDEAFSSLVADVLHKSVGPQTFLLEADGREPESGAWLWMESGFDLDTTLTAYRKGDMGVFKSLVHMTAAFNALGAALMEGSVEEGYHCQYSVGFSDAGKKKLSFPADHVFSRSVLSRRELSILDGRYQKSLIHTCFDPRDIKFMKSMVVVPVKFHSGEAYLLLAMRTPPSDVLDLLAPSKNLQ